MKFEKKTPVWQRVLLVIFAALLVFAHVKITMVGKNLQYLIPSPKPVSEATDVTSSSLPDITPDEMLPKPEFRPNGAISELQKSLKASSGEWDSVISAWTLSGVCDSTSIDSDSGGSVSGRVTLMGENGLIVHPLLMISGRQFFQDELREGANVAILDEKLALEIFSISEPLDRKITIQGVTYTVIGIARHTKDVGDYTDCGAYIPLMSAVPTNMQLDMLQVEAVPKEGAGASSSFRSVVTAWHEGGTFIDLGKEGMGAGLWMRVLIFIVGMTVVLRLVRFLNHQVAAYHKRYRAKLRLQYAVRLMPELCGMVLLFAAGYLMTAAIMVVMMNYIIQPVYTFTEWIPAVLVEWSDIAAAFWNVWQTPAVFMELRTPEILRLRFLGLVTQFASAGAGILLALMYARHRERRQDIAQGMIAMRAQGVVTSRIVTSAVLAFADLGYVEDESLPKVNSQEAPAQKRRRTLRLHSVQNMIRVLDPEKFLRSLPPSRKEGSFVVEITDDVIPENNCTFLIVCDGKSNRITETGREWDIQLTISALSQLACTSMTFHDYLESHTGFDMRRRSPAMDGIFGGKQQSR